MATVPPQPDTTPDTTPDSLPEPTPRPDEVAPLPGDVDVPDPTPDSNPPGFHAPSTSVGERASDETDVVGGTESMEAETGGLAGTSR